MSQNDNYNDIFSFSNSDDNQNNDAVDLNSFSSNAIDSQIKKQKRKRTGKQRALTAVLTVMLVGIISLSIVAATFLVYAFTVVDASMEEDLDDLKLNFTTTIYTQNKSGQWEEYQRLHGTYNRIWVSYDRESAQDKAEGYEGIPEDVVNAFVAIEDKRFRIHDGVDWKRTLSAFLNLLHGSKSYGGSTITQQLVKNLTNDNSKRVSRKVREIMRARYLEGHYAKDTIIECYLNTIAMGHGIYGVEVASNYYFDKSVKDLTLAESACLAAITKSPVSYAPDTKPEENLKRRKTVLSEMLSQGYITQEQYEAAINEDVKIVASKDALNENEVNNYFVDALIVQVTKDLAKKYNYDEAHAANNFYSGGYKIYATIDPSVQETVDSVYSNSDKYGIKGANGDQLQGSITVMDYEGHVKGIAGGIGQKTTNLGLSGFNRATDAKRQPGSSIKPISAYAPAIEKGIITYSSIVNDKATTYGGWTPVNWYHYYRGNVSVQLALEISINTIPVQLVNQLTPQVCYEFLTQKLGITTLTEKDIDLSPLGMGGTNGGINTLESAGAFSIFGNGGKFYKPTFYSKVCDQRDKVILDGEVEPIVAISEDTAEVMNHLLQNVVYGGSGTGKGAASFVPNMKIFAKTGTSNDVKDSWFVGGTPYYIASSWCGFDQQQKISNSTMARAMWGAVMSKINSGLEVKEYPHTDYAVRRYYCANTGLLATDACPSVAVGWYKTSNIPEVCTTHGGSALDSPDVAEKAQQEAASQEAQASQTTAENTQ